MNSCVLRVRLGFQAGAGLYLDIQYLKGPPVAGREQGEVTVAPLVLQQRRDGAYVKLLRALLLSLEQRREVHLQPARYLPHGRNGRVHLSALYLAQHALAHARQPGDGVQAQPPVLTHTTKILRQDGVYVLQSTSSALDNILHI